MRAQVAPRAIGILLGLQCTLNPLHDRPPTARSPTCRWPSASPGCRDPDVKAAILAEFPEHPMRTLRLDQMFELGDPPDYEPDPRRACRRAPRDKASTPTRCCTTCCWATGGTALLYLPILNYADGNLDAAGEMLAHPHTVPGLGDGGAHVGTICDASFPTTLLMHWGRDRTRGERFDLPCSCSARPPTPRRPSACSTAACSRRATAPTST